MLVGKANIEKRDLIFKCKTAEDIRALAISLIPKEFSHIPEIVDNQIYIICLHIRRCDDIKWSFKRPLIDEAMKDIKISGYIDRVIECRTLLAFTDMKRLHSFYKKGVK